MSKLHLILFLTISFVSGCLSFETRPIVVERNKASQPDWSKESPFKVQKNYDGALTLIAYTKNADSLENGAEEAFKKANSAFNDYFRSSYFENVDDKKIKLVTSRVLNEKKASDDYAICDVYYEKRQISSVTGEHIKDAYDTYLCLKIDSPERLVGIIKQKLNRGLLPGQDEGNTEIAH